MRAYLSRLAEFDRDLRLFMGYALLSYLGVGVFTLIFNLYLVQLGYDEAFIGAFNAVNTLAMGVTCVALGFLINRFGNWVCLALGTAEFVVVSIALCFVTDPTLVLVFAALNGFGQAFIATAQMPFIIEWAPRKHVTFAAALSSSLNSAAVMLGSLLGGALPGVLAGPLGVDGDSVLAYRWTLVVGLALSATALIPFMLMRTVRQQKHHAEFRMAHTQLLNVDVRRRARRDVIALILVGLFLALGVGAIEPFYNVLLDGMGLRAGSIGLIFALSSMASTVLSMASPAIFRRFGPIRSQLALRLMPVPFHLAAVGVPNAAAVSTAMISRKISGGMAWPIESSHVGSLLPPTARAHAFGLRSASWNFGYAVAALLSGWVISRAGSYVPAYIALAIFCSLSVTVYVRNYGNRAPVDTPELPLESEPLPLSPAIATPE